MGGGGRVTIRVLSLDGCPNAGATNGLREAGA